MCGPSQQQTAIAGQSQSLSTMLSAHYGERFGKQSAVLQNLNDIFTPIAQAGPDQQGFGSRELAALRTQAAEGTGADYTKATQALQNQLATRGGGSEVLPTGGEATLRGELASAAANQQSQQDLAITRANYAQGRSNWSQAVGGLSALAGEYQPTTFAGLAGQQNAQAFSQASQVQQMRNQKEAAIAGGLTSLAGSALTFGMGGLANLGAGESFGEGIGDFFKGGLSALGGR